MINANEILNALPSRYYLIDLDTKTIVQSNDSGVEANKSKCHYYLFGKESPCENSGNCLCAQSVEKGKSDFVIEKGDGAQKEFFKIRFSKFSENEILVISENVTSEFLIKKELKINTKRLERAERMASFGYWEFNIDEKIVIASKGAVKIYGLPSNRMTLEEIQAYPIRKFRKKLDKELEDLIVLGKPYNIKFQIKRPCDGEIRFIHSMAEYREDKRMVFGVIHDITDSIRADEELNNTNNLLRTVIDNIPDAIYMKDNQYRKLIANKGDAVNVGLKSAKEIIGRTDYDIYPKEIADVYTRDDKRVIERGEPIINREEILPAYGKNKVVLTSKFPLRNSENKIVGLVGIGRDITKIKESQEQLHLLQQTVHQTPLPVVITDKVGNIEFVNPGFTAVTGYEFDEVVGKNPRILKSGLSESDTSLYKKLWNTINSGQNWYGEFYNRKKDGSFYWENAVIAPIVDETGEIKHFVAIKEDITEKKQIIEDLKIAKDKAEESDRLKSIFLTNLSHEIRTPLNGILGFSNIICSGISEPAKLDYYGTLIENSGRRLIKVIDDIIDMSMLQSNQIKLNYSEFDLNEIIRELFDLYRDIYQQKLSDINFSMELCKNGDGILVSDKTRVTQVIKNVLDNAFKFTEKGFIKFGYFNSTHKQVTLFVEDSGIGIEADKSKIIYEPFRQGEEGHSRKYEGSGLGLTISKAVMQKLEGKIALKSEENKGSTFYLKFQKN